MLRDIDNYFLVQQEPVKSCLLALREIVVRQDKHITAAWKYGMPFFCYKGKMFCYLWTQKHGGMPYLGIVEGNRISHPLLIAESRARMKIILIRPEKDIPVKTIEGILKQALDLYRNGIIKI